MTTTTSDFADQTLKSTGLDTTTTNLAGDKPLFDRAKAMIEDAVDLTVGAIKENPVAAAAIVGGVAATVAGAAFGVSKLRENTSTTTTLK